MAEITRRAFNQSLAASAVAGALAQSHAFSAHAATGGGDDLTAMTLTEAAAKIRSGAVTSVQLTEACLNRTDVYNPKLNGFITVMHEAAMAQARILDQEAAGGKIRSPLHGVPIAIKDNIDTAGTRTTAASALFDDRVPTQDAHVVTRLKEAGAVLLGKTNMHEFGMGITSATSYFGPVRNPWALDRSAGGSSGGSAAVVAAHLAYGAIGTDSGGSVRIPAAWCGVVGLKLTYGLASYRGIISQVPSVDVCGPLARTVEDAALLLEAMAGYDKLDVASIEHPREDYLSLMKQPVNHLRVGVPRVPFFDHLDADTSRCIQEALGVLNKLSAGIREVVLPPLPSGWTALVFGEIAAYQQENLLHSAGRYMPGTRQLFQGIEAGLNNPATGTCSAKVTDYVRARWELELMRRTIDDAFADYDVVALPTMRALPPTVDEAMQQEQQAAKVSDPVGSNLLPFNLLGLPAISIPCGYSSSGLPVGLMIGGPHFSEGRLLAIANAYQRATGWNTRKPRMRPHA